MKIIDSTIVHKSKFVTLAAVTYEDQRSNTKNWHMVSRGETPKCISGEIQRPDAAIIVPYHAGEDKLVVIREFRVTSTGSPPDCWTLVRTWQWRRAGSCMRRPA